MPDTRYRDLREAVEDANNNAFLFHQTVDQLALMLGFIKIKEWYEAEPILPPRPTRPFFSYKIFEFKNLDDLKACIKEGVLFHCFEHNNQYENGRDVFRSSTLHNNYISLVLNKFNLCTITSNSTLGLNYDVLSHSEFNLRFPEIDSRPDVMIAFDNKCLIKRDNNYLMNPKYLLRLAEQKGMLR